MMKYAFLLFKPGSFNLQGEVAESISTPSETAAGSSEGAKAREDGEESAVEVERAEGK